MLLLCVTRTDDSDGVGVRVGCSRTVGLRVPPEGWLRGLAAAMALHLQTANEVAASVSAATPQTGRWSDRRPDSGGHRELGSGTCPGPMATSHGLGAGGHPSTEPGTAGRAGIGAPCSEGQDQEPTSTKASVRSLARSITGKWRPATIFTFSFPGITAASASPRIPAETNKRVCAERASARGGGGAEGEPRGRAEGRRERAPTDSGGRARRTHALSRNQVVPRGRRGLIPEKQPEEGRRPAVLP